MRKVKRKKRQVRRNENFSLLFPSVRRDEVGSFWPFLSEACDKPVAHFNIFACDILAAKAGAGV